MRHLLVALLLLIAAPISAQLLPYGEADVFDIDGRSTFFSLLNASASPVIAGISVFDRDGEHEITLRRRINPGQTFVQNTRSWFAGPLVVCSTDEGDLIAPAGTLDDLIGVDGLARFIVDFQAFADTGDGCLLEGPLEPLAEHTLRGDVFFVDGRNDFATGLPMVTEEPVISLEAGIWSVRFNVGAGSFDGSFLVFRSPEQQIVRVRGFNEAGELVFLQTSLIVGGVVDLGLSSMIDIAMTFNPSSDFGRLEIECPKPCAPSGLWVAQGRYSATVPGHWLGMPFVAIP